MPPKPHRRRSSAVMLEGIFPSETVEIERNNEDVYAAADQPSPTNQRSSLFVSTSGSAFNSRASVPDGRSSRASSPMGRQTRSQAMVPLEQFEFMQQLHAYTGAGIADPTQLSDDDQTSSDSDEDVAVVATKTRVRRMSVDIEQERINAEKDPNEFDDAAAQLKEFQNRQQTRKSMIREVKEKDKAAKERKAQKKRDPMEADIGLKYDSESDEEEEKTKSMVTKPLRASFVSHAASRKSLRVLAKEQFENLNRRVVNKALVVDADELQFQQHVTKIVDSWLLQEGETLFLDTMVDPLAVQFEKHCTSFITRYLTLCESPESGINFSDRSDLTTIREKVICADMAGWRVPPSILSPELEAILSLQHILLHAKHLFGAVGIKKFKRNLQKAVKKTRSKFKVTDAKEAEDFGLIGLQNDDENKHQFWATYHMCEQTKNLPFTHLSPARAKLQADQEKFHRADLVGGWPTTPASPMTPHSKPMNLLSYGHQMNGVHTAEEIFETFSADYSSRDAYKLCKMPKNDDKETSAVLMSQRSNWTPAVKEEALTGMAHLDSPRSTAKMVAERSHQLREWEVKKSREHLGTPDSTSSNIGKTNPSVARFNKLRNEIVNPESRIGQFKVRAATVHHNDRELQPKLRPASAVSKYYPEPHLKTMDKVISDLPSHRLNGAHGGLLKKVKNARNVAVNALFAGADQKTPAQKLNASKEKKNDWPGTPLAELRRSKNRNIASAPAGSTLPAHIPGGGTKYVDHFPIIHEGSEEQSKEQSESSFAYVAMPQPATANGSASVSLKHVGVRANLPRRSSANNIRQIKNIRAEENWQKARNSRSDIASQWKNNKGKSPSNKRRPRTVDSTTNTNTLTNTAKGCPRRASMILDSTGRFRNAGKERKERSAQMAAMGLHGLSKATEEKILLQNSIINSYFHEISDDEDKEDRANSPTHKVDTISSLNKKKYRDTNLEFDTTSNMDESSQLGTMSKEASNIQTETSTYSVSVSNNMPGASTLSPSNNTITGYTGGFAQAAKHACQERLIEQHEVVLPYVDRPDNLPSVLTKHSRFKGCYEYFKTSREKGVTPLACDHLYKHYSADLLDYTGRQVDDVVFEAVIDSLPYGQPQEAILLGGNDLTDDVLEKMWATLHRLKMIGNVKEIDLSYNPRITQRSALRLGAIVAANVARNLTIFRFSGIKITPDVVRVLHKAFDGAKLRELDLAYCQIGRRNPHTTVIVAEIISNLPELRVLDLSGNHFGHRGLEELGMKIRALDYFAELHMSFNAGQVLPASDVHYARSLGEQGEQMLRKTLGEEGFANRFPPMNNLVEYLGQCRYLTHVDLRASQLTQQSAFVLANSICIHPNVRTVLLSNNPLGQAGVRALLRLLYLNPYPPNRQMRHLDIDHCQMEAPATRIEEMVAYNFHDPSASYRLLMDNPYCRAIAVQCFRRWQMIEKNPGCGWDDVFEDMRLDGVKYKAELDPKYNEWDLPRRGILTYTCRFKHRPDAQTTDMSELYEIPVVWHHHLSQSNPEGMLLDCLMVRKKLKQMPDHMFTNLMYCFSRTTSDVSKIPIVAAIAKDFSLASRQLMALIDGASRAIQEDVISLLLDKVEDPAFAWDPLKLALAQEECNVRAYGYGSKGSFATFHHFCGMNASGHYKLTLEFPQDYIIAQHCMALNYWEVELNKHIMYPNQSQTGNFTNFRNETFDGKTFVSGADFSLPPRGTWEFDYFSTRRAPKNVICIKQETRVEIQAAIRLSAAEEKTKLGVLKKLSYSYYITSEDLSEFVTTFESPVLRRDCVVMLFNRVKNFQDIKVDIFKGTDEFKAVLGQGDIPFVEKRTGPIALFNPNTFDYFRFDFTLKNHDERILAENLFLIAQREDPKGMISMRQGPNWNSLTTLTSFPEIWSRLVPGEGVLRLEYGVDDGRKNFGTRKTIAQNLCGWDVIKAREV